MLVVLLALLLAFGGWFLGSGRYTDTPPVLGLTQAAAEQRLATFGLSASLGPADFDERVAPGLVLRQTPATNGRVRKGGSVSLVLSKGVDLRPVPRLAGLSRQAAADALAAAGLTLGTVTEAFSATVPQGQVIASTPPVDTRLRERTTVSLVLSRGVELLAVPDVRGTAQSAAEQALQAAGFRTTVTAVFSDKTPAGIVTNQEPREGTAPRDSAIVLSVSNGPDLVTVPKLDGLAEDEATALLASLGLRSKVKSIPGPGIVREQSPSPGSRARRGSTVTLYVF